MLILIILGALALVGIGGTMQHVLRDGYGRMPDRPGAIRASDLRAGSRSSDFA
ncbi:hypothetical protein RCH16_001689 [Cryobacterium sp. MP_M5]|uniref:hypothetical protein n=1 Tax=unclassified Cryobacterium TaxID=2649013 RepID=UPI0018CB04DB|nr:MULTISPECIES: hypothetical protein [unclassified Cryobacterium]MBG6058075.1 hypothetical protein [Cryobacterium sp. MP_M3]MEC5176681.1 hypothetical protein [Cryobacterium sp. MP_M5]